MRSALRILMLCAALVLPSVLPGCARPSQEQVLPGLTTESNLEASLGKASHVWTPAARAQARLHDYPDGCSYQIERKIVVGISCPPSSAEVTLQYWRHKWIGQSQIFEELPSSANVHGQKRYQLACKSAGMAVVYDEASERVLRVVRYEKH